MSTFFKLLLIIFFISSKAFATESDYIFNEKSMNYLYSISESYFKKSRINLIKDSMGIILRYIFEDPIDEYFNKNYDVYKKIEHFLAKIENSAIIEVHLEDLTTVKNLKNMKAWELSTIMANDIEAIMTIPQGLLKQNRISSVGYGEFLPRKNTSNNGGKKSNRLDIIIQCNINGE